VIADPPQALLAGVVESGGLTWGDRLVAHPALARSAGRMARADLPEKLLLCGGPVIPQTLAVLADARRRIVGAQR
jgi:iron complex transport system substrate-binding protein